MGNVWFKNVYDIPYVARYKRVYQAFQISPAELKKFHNLFSFFDTDHSGEIDLQEFFRHMEIGVTPFGDRIFRIMDEDGSGQIDFREFVMSLWNYCTLTTSTLELFAFDLYDKDSTGELSVEEVHQMLQDMYGSEMRKTKLAEIISNNLLKKSLTGRFNIDMFRDFVHTHPAFLFPAFRIQLALQTHILGTRYWERASEKRLTLSNNKYVDFAELLRMNVDKTFYEDRIHRYHINDLLAHISSKENAFESMTQHESKAHEAAAMILHYTGTYHYRHKVAQIDQQQPHKHTSSVQQPLKKKLPLSFVAIMKGLFFISKGKDSKKKKSSSIQENKDDEENTILGGRRSSSKDILQEPDEEEEETTINLMKPLKFEGSRTQKTQREFLHSDMHSIGQDIDPVRMRFQDSNKHPVHHNKHLHHHHHKGSKIQQIVPIPVPVNSPATSPFATPIASPRNTGMMTPPLPLLSHTKSIANLHTTHHSHQSHQQHHHNHHKVVPINY